MWQMLRRGEYWLLFAAIGLIQGVVLYSLSEYESQWLLVGQAGRAAVLLFVSLTPVIFYFVFDSKHLRSSILFTASWGAVYAAIGYSWHALRSTEDQPATISLALFFTSVLTSWIFNACFVSWRDRSTRLDYRRWIDAVSEAIFYYLSAMCVTAVILGVMFLWGETLSLFGIDIVADLLERTAVWSILSTTCYGAAFGLLRRHAPLVASARMIVLAPIAAISPIFAVIAVSVTALVALTLVGVVVNPPASGWRTAISATELLALGTLSVLMVNAVLREGPPGVTPSRTALWSSAAHMLAAPVLVGLAGFSIVLRIEQYGLTPQRVNAALVAAALMLVTLAYAVAVCLRGVRWPEAITRCNPALALLVATTAFATLTPLLDANRLAVDNQYRRLITGAVAPREFDFDLLQFESGRAGRDALERMRSDPEMPDRDVVLEEINLARQFRWWSEWNTARTERRSVIDPSAFLVVGSQEPPPAELLRDIAKTWTSNVRRCVAGQSRCALVAADLKGDAEFEYVLVEIEESNTFRATAFERVDGRWRNYALGRRGDLPGDAWAALSGGDVGRLEPDFWDLRIGTTRIPLPPNSR